MSDSGLEYHSLFSSLILIGGGLYGLVRSRQVAARNRAYVEGGEEHYFEERRAWNHYPTQRPITDPDRIRRLSRLGLAGGVAAILLYSPVSIFHWS
jgi:hypothetical protein